MKRIKLLLILSALLFSSSLWAQVTVSGNVTDSEGEPLIGVSVIIQGTSQGTITDVKGNYSLSVPGPESVLVFSYIGFKNASSTVGNRSTIDVSLEEDAEQLEEVVVSALGFKQNKDALGSTYSNISTDDATRSGEAVFGTSLAAKASNVQIAQTTGDPGAGTTIRIRGANSITGGTSPLIILDGIPISNTTFYGESLGGNSLTGGSTGGTVQQSRINDINPNDIESITILKGASAASLWGSRAANGVIVITTKSGKQGKLNISYKATVSFDQVHDRIPMQNTYGQGTNGNQSESAGESWGDYIPDRSGAANDVDQTGQFFEARDGTIYYPIIDKNSHDTYVEENWDAVFQTAGFTQHDITISGGNEKSTFFSSISRLDQEGIIRNSDYDRTNFRLNSTFELSDWLNFGSKAAYINSSSNRIQQNSNTAGVMLGLLRQAPDFDSRDYIGTYTSNAGEIFTNRHRAYRSQVGAASTSPAYNNPLWTIFEQSATSKLDRFTLAGDLSIIPTQWLQFTLRGGVDSYTETREYFFPIHSAGSRNPGQYAEDVIKENEVNFDAIGKAEFELSSDINLQATLGWNYNDRKRNITAAAITGFLANVRKTTADLNSAAEASTYDNSKRFIRSNRGYAVFALDMYDQVTVNGSAAVEAASSVKGTFFYPAIDVAWRLSEAIDLSSTPITFAKARVSWGRVGVQPQPHRFETTAEGGFSYSSYDSELGIALHGGGFRLNDDLGNPDLEPEIKTEWEIGGDIRMFSDKLNFSFTYYQNDIEGLLIPVDLTPSGGFDTQYANAADMENKGFEMDLNYEILRQGDWTVGANFNWATNKNEVTRLEGTETIDLSPGASVSSRAIVGEPLGTLYGTGSQKNDDGSLLLDANGFPQLTLSPEVLGDPNPDWAANLGLNASWKAFSLNILFEHSHGGDFSPRTQWVLRRFGTTKETANTLTLDQDLVNFDGDVITAGTRVRGNIEDFGAGPVLLDETWYRHGIGGGFGDNQAYNFSIVSSQFTRLRELSLSYVLNTSGFQEKTKLNSIVFTATGRNLLLWTDLVGVDPQVNQTGVGNARGLDYFTNPSTKSFLFSIGINF